MDIVFVSAEVAPYSKAGGLADVAGSLPQALTPYAGSVRVITPFYGDIDRNKYQITSTKITGQIKMGKESVPYEVFQSTPQDSEMLIWFIGCDQYYSRPGIYTEANGEGFSDNNNRYFFFQLVVLDLIRSGSVSADILHCNDHHTGLLPVLMKVAKIDVKTVFTIHNFLYHGHFSDVDLSLLPEGTSAYLQTTQWDNYSALLEAIDHSQVITTVSPGYARELLDGENVDDHSLTRIKLAASRFSGIVNGIDQEYWSPELDDFTPFHFNKHDLEGKRKNKRELLIKSGLELDLDAPVFGSISRLVENKGFLLILDLLDEFVERGAKFIFLGSGNPEIAEQLRQACNKHPRHIAFDDGFNEPLAHLIEAGSDLFLMPSRFEPCGLNQLYSLRYGTIPIVHRTGGLGDTVEPWTAETGTGFLFQPYKTKELRQAMDQALHVYSSDSLWKALMVRAMSQDFSWDRSARQYYQLYQDRK